MAGFLDELRWRGLLNAATDGAEQAFAAAERSAGPGRAPLVGYIGFDPTADSLHIGSLLPVMLLVHLGRQGHRPIALIGGGTGLIGDPSGKSTERVLADRDTVQENAERIGAQLRKFDLETANNIEWLDNLRAIDLLRDTGKHFTVNYMLQKDSVKSRMDAGISFTEFSYMLLQAYDFLQLHKRYNVNLQMGGSDQWGNITAGIELIRRTEGADAFGVTAPLVTTASGTKFGKTEAGAVWLDPAKTSPYQFYQFWINIEDRDVGKYLRYFTLLQREEIENLEQSANDASTASLRAAQQALAKDVTTLIHGSEAAKTAKDVSNFLFAGGSPEVLDQRAFAMLRREIPNGTVNQSEQGTVDVLALLTGGGLASSRGEARRLVQQGGVSIDGKRLPAEQLTLPANSARWPGYFLVKKGARDYALLELVS
jgi:tyrosyl-tRNA synthetase